jgi:hypothetical protein
MLVKKADGVRQASAEAQEALESLKGEQKTKVRVFLAGKLSISDYGSRPGSSKISSTGNNPFIKWRKLRNSEFR